MKIAVSSDGEGLDDRISDVFGRCPFFVISDIKNKKIQYIGTIENPNINQKGGAGISTAQLVVEEEVKVVITRNVGPRASDVLKQFKIEVYNGNGCKSVKDALQKFINGKLKKIQ